MCVMVYACNSGCSVVSAFEVCIGHARTHPTCVHNVCAPTASYDCAPVNAMFCAQLQGVLPDHFYRGRALFGRKDMINHDKAIFVQKALDVSGLMKAKGLDVGLRPKHCTKARAENKSIDDEMRVENHKRREEKV